MKSLLSVGAVALAMLAGAQDPGLSRGRGGGGGGGGQSSPPPSRQAPTPPAPSRPAPTPQTPSREPSREPAPSRTDSGNQQERRSPIRSGGGGSGDAPLTRNGTSQGVVRTPGNRARVSGPLRTGTPIIVGQAPSRGDFSRLPNRVYRSENIGIVGGYRVGYVHYDNRWRSDNFYYSYYGYSPFDGFACVSSPFYGYTFLPPYISYSRVFIESYSPGWSFTIGYPLTWSSYRYYDDGAYDQGYWNGRRDSDDRRFEEARYATRDLADAFEDGNARGVNRLLPRNGRIAILREGSYDYALSSDEFGRMLDDLIENSRTERYRIVESRGYGREVRVVARHDYTDPWGERRTMFHHILLSPEDGRYVIREFGTSSQRFW